MSHTAFALMPAGTSGPCAVPSTRLHHVSPGALAPNVRALQQGTALAPGRPDDEDGVGRL